jgi:hypothetical protein
LYLTYTPGVYKQPQAGWKEMEEVKGFAIIHIVQRRTTGYKAGELQIQTKTT